MKNCLHCGKFFNKKENKFCSSSCSATFNNLRKKSKHRKLCKWCGAVTINKMFCSVKCRSNNKRFIFEKDALNGIGKGTAIKRILLREQNHSCAICKNSEWIGCKIPLELDHKDGNSENWNPINLRLLCPNCHSMTPTFRAKNKGNGRSYRRIMKICAEEMLESVRNDCK